MEMEMVIMTSKLSCINNGGEHVPLVVAVVFAFRWWSKCKCRLLLINRYWDTGKNKSTAGYPFFLVHIYLIWRIVKQKPLGTS